MAPCSRQSEADFWFRMTSKDDVSHTLCTSTQTHRCMYVCTHVHRTKAVR